MYTPAGNQNMGRQAGMQQSYAGRAAGMGMAYPSVGKGTVGSAVDERIVSMMSGTSRPNQSVMQVLLPPIFHARMVPKA